ncbi:MAG: DUF502 domain-containing protein [Chitinophagales bacterium]|jgi:uncharacterized membrane protein|nr:DUF502 domain-containing protein [Sphingobacteriales bacterium]
MKFELKNIGAYLLRGTFITAPVLITFYVLWVILGKIDSPVQEIFYSIFGFRIYGLGLITVIFLLIIVGYLGTHILMDKIFKGLESLILRVPIVKEVYKAIRDVIGAFASDKKKFEKPVLVKVGEGIHRIGFITSEELSDYDIDSDLVSVYFPLSYAFTGELLLVDKSLLSPLDTKDVKDLMKFVISGGIVHGEKK